MAARLIDLGDGVKIPTEIIRSWEDVGGYVVELTAAYDAGSGRYVARKVDISAGAAAEVTGEGLRMIPVAGLLRHAVAESAAPRLAPDPRRHPTDWRKLGPTEETLRHVARVYRLALLLGDAPTQRVAEALVLPRSTASRWVTRARDRGYLTVTDRRGSHGIGEETR